MKKRDFIKQSALLAGALTMSNFSALSNVLGSFKEENYTMPVLFYRAWFANECLGR